MSSVIANAAPLPRSISFGELNFLTSSMSLSESFKDSARRVRMPWAGPGLAGTTSSPPSLGPSTPPLAEPSRALAPRASATPYGADGANDGVEGTGDSAESADDGEGRPPDRSVSTGEGPEDPNDGHETITAENAQSVYSPAACVFVANLDRTRTRAELAEELTKTFSHNGQCWVKVRWGQNNIPFSFVQFRDVDAAEHAANTMQGARIFGRPCRIEKARAQRTLFCSRKDGAAVTCPIVFNQLRPFGEMEQFWFPTRNEQALYNIPDGVFIRFALFQPCQDAVKALRTDPDHDFTMQPVKIRSRGPTNAPLFYGTTHNAIYVGDLPGTITEADLAAIFEAYGKVLSITLRQRPHKKDKYAFIHFSSPWAAVAAYQFPYKLMGRQIARIELRRGRYHGYPTMVTRSVGGYGPPTAGPGDARDAPGYNWSTDAGGVPRAHRHSTFFPQ